MKVLIACEYSGRVREAFRKLGHNAWSCDLLPAEDGSPYHLNCDVRDVLDFGWDLMIAHPDCTYLCSSGLHWNKRGALVDGRPRQELTEEALGFVQLLMDAPIPRIAIENPIGCISSRIRKPDQIIQPHQYGDDASKSTCLWLKGLPKLHPTNHVHPRMVCGCGNTYSSPADDEWACPVCNGKHKALPRWANQTDSGQNKLGPSDDRWKERARTYQGWADAMAWQWGGSSRIDALESNCNSAEKSLQESLL